MASTPAPEARMPDPVLVEQVTVGLFAAGGGPLRLPTRVGVSRAMKMALTGDPVTAEQARDAGLVARVTEPGAALAEALWLAQRIARNAPLGVMASKALVAATQGVTAAEFWELQEEHQQSVFGSDDAREGPRAFAEKRPPRWTGA